MSYILAYCIWLSCNTPLPIQVDVIMVASAPLWNQNEQEEDRRSTTKHSTARINLQYSGDQVFDKAKSSFYQNKFVKLELW